MRGLNIFFFSFLLIDCGNNNYEEFVDDVNYDNDLLQDENCLQNGKDISFFLEGYTEGSEGTFSFKNDTLLERIQFSFATSMKLLEQTYFFKENEIVNYIQKTNFIKLDKSGYIKSDSFTLNGNEIINNINFDSVLFNEILKTAHEKNPCFQSVLR